VEVQGRVEKGPRAAQGRGNHKKLLINYSREHKRLLTEESLENYSRRAQELLTEHE
jgi:hypothetical protein